MKNFISDEDFEKNIGVSNVIPSNFISDSDFEKNIGVVSEQEEKKDIYSDRAKGLSDSVAFLLAAEKGIRGVTQGAKQLGLMGLEKLQNAINSEEGFNKSQIAKKLGININFIEPGNAKRFAEEEAKNLGYYPAIKSAHPLSSLAGEITGGVAATLPLGAVSLPAKIGYTAINPVARTIGTGATQGGIIGALEFDPTAKNLSDKAVNALLGATVGGVVPAAFLGGKRVIKGKGSQEAIEQTKQLKQLSKELGVDLSVPELRGSVGGKYAESLLEKIPGTGYIGFREKQIEQLKKSAENIYKEVGEDITENYGEVVQKSLKETLKKNKEIAKSQFDKVEKIANAQGGKIDFNNTQNEARTILEEFVTLPKQFQNPTLIGYAEKFSNIEKLPFNVARELRSKLGDDVSKLKKSSNMGTAEAQEYRMATRLFGSVENDMDQFAEKAGGSLKSAYAEARKTYKDKVVPFKKNELAKVLKDDYDTNLLLGTFLKPGRENLASKLINNTNNKGLTAARASILNDAIESASQGQFFNAEKFAKEALRLGKANKVLFTKEQLTNIEGFSKIAKAAERASKFAANPETGSRLTGPVALFGATAASIANPKFALAILGGLGAAKLMRSDLGRKILTRASHLPENGADKSWSKLLVDASKLVAPIETTSSSIPEQD